MTIKKSAYRIGIVGATGAVGREILRLIEQRNFPESHISLMASARSAGRMLPFKGLAIRVREVTPLSFDDLDLVFFSAGASCSREFVPAALEAGAVVIDNSSAFRLQEDVPLVVPGVNDHVLADHHGLIANPNCCAAILVTALAPLHREAEITRIVVSTYQSASGAGAQAMAELEEQTRAVLSGQEPTPRVFPYPISFNLFSHNSAVGADGFNEEERKLMQETRKILELPTVPISATCIRVPVLRAHSLSVTIGLKKPLSVEHAREMLSHAPGVKLVDDREKNHFPMPLEATGDLDIHVGRIRNDPIFGTPGLSLFICGDQLLRGAAWNAVQIAEKLSL